MKKYEDIITNKLQTYTHKFRVQSNRIDNLTPVAKPARQFGHAMQI